MGMRRKAGERSLAESKLVDNKGRAELRGLRGKSARNEAQYRAQNERGACRAFSSRHLLRYSSSHQTDHLSDVCWVLSYTLDLPWVLVVRSLTWGS